MSPEMQRMLAEWEARDRPQLPIDHIEDPLIAEIERAAQYLDEGGTERGKWPASAILLIGYCAIITSPYFGAEQRAVDFACRHLSEARRRWKAGFFANPFGEPVPRAEDRSR